MAHLTRAPGTRAAMAFANARLAMSEPSLAGTGTSQHGPSMSAAISCAARSMASSVGTFKLRAVWRTAISSWLAVRWPSPTYFATYRSFVSATANEGMNNPFVVEGTNCDSGKMSRPFTHRSFADNNCARRPPLPFPATMEMTNPTGWQFPPVSRFAKREQTGRGGFPKFSGRKIEKGRGRVSTAHRLQQGNSHVPDFA